jgi:FtsP/CotA-like multicopper oxidase with cupredoxin domain
MPRKRPLANVAASVHQRLVAIAQERREEMQSVLVRYGVERLLYRLNNNFIHPMHMHGGPFTVVARDGVVLAPSARFEADVINVGPGQRYDVIWPAREPGKWILHCHIPHHTLNNNVEEQGAGGLTLLVDVTR